MPERERAQERAQRRGRHHPVAEHTLQAKSAALEALKEQGETLKAELATLTERVQQQGLQLQRCTDERQQQAELWQQQCQALGLQLADAAALSAAKQQQSCEQADLQQRLAQLDSRKAALESARSLCQQSDKSCNEFEQQ